MEETADGRCSVVYLCTSAHEDLTETYNAKNIPSGDKLERGEWWRERILGNVRALLDEDRGGFEEVYVASSAQKVVDQLEIYSSAVPTVLLVEILGMPGERRGSRDLQADKEINAVPILEALATDAQGAHYQKHVMPFAIIAARSPQDQPTAIDANTASRCLSAGALEVLQSPMDHSSINRLVSHVKQQTRPPARLVGAAMAQNLVDSIRNTNAVGIPCHRPDQSVPLDRRKQIEQNVTEWGFRASDYDWDELTCAAVFMLEHMLRNEALAEYAIPREDLIHFLLATRRQYKHERQVHYHNWRHAVDVTQSVYWFLLRLELCPPISPHKAEGGRTPVEKLLTPIDGLILIISAIGHDVGHPGVNNAFLVACNHPLAQMYNDKSVLENYHCAAYSQLLRRHWPSLNTIPSFRTTMISTILATDMQRHFEYMGTLNEFKERVLDADFNLDDWSEKDLDNARGLLMALLIKAADISNVARPFDISSSWATILLSEFARQGELENELDIPTCLFGGPPEKDDLLAAAQSQQGFINLFGFPLFSGIAEVAPHSSKAVDCLKENKDLWSKRIEEEKKKRESNGRDAPLTIQPYSPKGAGGASDNRHQPDDGAAPEDMSGEDSLSPLQREHTHGSEGSPTRPATSELKQQLVHTFMSPFAGGTSQVVGYSPKSLHTASSRRSSKDMALDHLSQLSLFGHNTFSSVGGSRRNSGASFHQPQGYPGSRRGSKDESLTTILVTSGGSPGRRSSPAGSTGRVTRNDSPTAPQHGMSKRQSAALSASRTRSQKQSIVSASEPSSRSQTTSSATVETMEPTSTQPSSLAATETNDDVTPSARHASIPATEDPFLVPGNWPNDLDGTHRASAPEALPSTAPPPKSSARANPGIKPPKADSPGLMPRVASGDSQEGQQGVSKAKEPGLRESRSRTRLRNLKFWKKKKDSNGSGQEGIDTQSP